MPSLPFLPFAAPPPIRRWLLAACYLAAFVTLDWASYIRPLQGLNITPWNPQPALAVALLMWRPRRIWLVWLGLAAAELVVRGVPGDLAAAAATTIAMALAYAGIAWALRNRIGAAASFRTRADLFWFAVIVVGGSLACAVIYVTTFSSGLGAGEGARLAEPGAIARYWVGDAVGLMVTFPVLVSLADPARRAALGACLASAEWWLAAAATCACLWLVFSGAEQDWFKYFYVLLVPVVWSSARFGFPGAVLSAAFTQLGLIGAAQMALRHDLTLFELQALMAASAFTALLVGVLVDERAQAAIELRRSLRFAAAGQMTAALAHELSQPLTALGNYALACRMLAEAPDADPARREQLAHTLQQLSAEAQRAGDVVKRLRDFFRSGSTALVPANPSRVLADAVAAQREDADKRAVALSSDIPPDLPAVWFDPVQVAVVVRNLLANAIEAAAPAATRQVHLKARRAGGDVVVEVFDSGPGVDAARLRTLFEAAPSSKAEGLGIGLSICRAIIETHGGKLWGESGRRGHFLFTLPLGDHVIGPTADPA